MSLFLRFQWRSPQHHKLCILYSLHPKTKVRAKINNKNNIYHMIFCIFTLFGTVGTSAAHPTRRASSLATVAHIAGAVVDP